MRETTEQRESAPDLRGWAEPAPEAASGRPGRWETEANRVEPGRFPIDLKQQEGIDNAHVLREHGGRSDEELRERLRDQQELPAASTFTDKKTAQEAVQAVVNANESEISAWLKSGDFPRSTFSHTFAEPVGRVWRRSDFNGGKGPTEANHVILVLQRSDSERNTFVVYTAKLEDRTGGKG